MAERDAMRVIEEAERLITERTAMTVDELAAALRERGIDPGPDEEILDLLYDDLGTAFIPLPDGRWAHLPTLLRDRIFTHRLTDVEVEHDVLTINPDLEPILIMEDEALHLPDGELLHLAFSRHPQDPGQRMVPAEALDKAGRLVLPTGTLARVEGGAADLVGLRVGAEGISVHRVDRAELTSDPGPVVERLREMAGRPNPPHLLTDVVFGTCIDLPELFRRPLPPLTDLVAEAGLASHGDWLAPGGFDFDQHFLDLQVNRLMMRHELTRDEALSFLVLLRLRERVSEVIDAIVDSQPGEEPAVQSVRSLEQAAAEGLDGHTVASSLPILAEPYLARAFLTEALGYHDQGAPGLSLMVDGLAAYSPRPVRPALRWLEAKAYERMGQISRAEEGLIAAEKLDPDWSPVLLDLARYASDRGDAARGLALIQRAAPEEEDPLLQDILTAFLPTPGPVVGRNDPCWCGSGRKFKQCHLYRPAARPLDERAAWLYQKAVRFLQDGPWPSVLEELEAERQAYVEEDEESAALDVDPFVADVALFEAGAFADFLDERGELLPEDERMLAAQWLLVERSVFEVTGVRRGEGFDATDLRTGDVHQVRDRAASRQLKPGMIICARIVPAAETVQVFGGIEPVPLGDLDVLIELLDEDEPDPEKLVAFCSRRFAPPLLTNTEGDSLVLCDLVLSVSDPDALRSELDGEYRRIDPEALEWIQERTIDGMDRILANLRLEGPELHVNTNSERRLEDVLTSIKELDPGASVVSDERQAVPNARAAAKLAEQRSPGAALSGRPEDQPPEVQEALAAYMRDYEQKWLDLSVPALRGLTPRQAAEDPTRREDLVRLLSSFGDEHDNPTAMSPSRLRTALGLT